MANYFAEKYDFFLNELADPRVKNWAGLTSPAPTLMIIAAYLLSVYVILPNYMKHRKPYKLKSILYYYNLFQIASCIGLIYGIVTAGWTTEYTMGCQPVDYSDRPIAIRMLTFFYLCYILKGIEMVETAMFILRKKYNQVTKLHVYHHASTFFLAWVGCKYVGGGMASFPLIINSFIHILMYTYYLLSSLGPAWQKKVTKWKSTLTMMQMIQFCILIVHSLQSLHPDCNVPKELLLLYVPNVLLIFHMFSQFYKESYGKGSKQKAK